MLVANDLKMASKPIANGLRKHDATILLPFASTHDDLPPIEVKVLDP